MARTTKAESLAITASLPRYAAKHEQLLNELANSCRAIEREFEADGLSSAAARAWVNYTLRHMLGHPDNLGAPLDISAPQARASREGAVAG